jgi:hypothetical protein
MPICAKCQSETPSEELHEYSGQMLCDDCYMDALSPARACDPWAVYTASRLPDQELNQAQESILALLQKRGEAEAKELMEACGLGPKELEREIAALRHMEMVRGALTPEGRKVLKLFNDHG